MTPLETLKSARELISDPARWTQKTPARDAEGRPCDPRYERACCWCLKGAVLRYAHGGPYVGGPVDKINKVSRKLFKGQCAIVVNDQFGHRAALDILDVAIEELS